MKRVLLIDDDQNFTAGILRLMRHATWVTDVVSDPRQALRKLDRENYSVIVSDYLMPEVDGVSFLEYARAKQKAAVRILFTGHADMSALADAVNMAGVFRILFKPCPANELLDHIHDALRQFETQEQLEPGDGVPHRQYSKINLQRAEISRLERDHPDITEVFLDESGVLKVRSGK